MRAIMKTPLTFVSITYCSSTRRLQCILCAARNFVSSFTEPRGNRSRRASIALVAATWMVSGCSPYLYEKEVGSFSSSVSDVWSAVTQGLNNLDQDQSAAVFADVVSARAGVNLSAGCGSEDPNQACRLMVIPKTNPDTSAVDKFGPVKPQLLRVLVALKGYADGLAAVTNAQDRKDYDAAASQLSSSVAELGTALGAAAPGGAAAGPALSAVTELVTWTIGEGLDAARYTALRSAINAVGSPSIDVEGLKTSAIQIVADKAITPELKAVRSARIMLLFRQLDARANRINSDLAAAKTARVSLDRYDTPLMELASLVATLNAIKAVDPEAVGSSLVNAHDELQKAVNDKSRQFQNLLSSLSDFADKAAAVQKAFAKNPTAVK